MAYCAIAPGGMNGTQATATGASAMSGNRSTRGAVTSHSRRGVAAPARSSITRSSIAESWLPAMTTVGASVASRPSALTPSASAS